MFTCCGSSLSLPLDFFLLGYPSFLLLWPQFPSLFVYCDASFIPPFLIPSCSSCLTLLFLSFSVLSSYSPSTSSSFFLTTFLSFYFPFLLCILLDFLLFYLKPSFLTFPCASSSFFTPLFFHCLEMTQSDPKHTHTHHKPTNSSYDMQMQVKILTVYLTHIITQLNARAGVTAAM